MISSYSLFLCGQTYTRTDTHRDWHIHRRRRR